MNGLQSTSGHYKYNNIEIEMKSKVNKHCKSSGANTGYLSILGFRALQAMSVNKSNKKAFESFCYHLDLIERKSGLTEYAQILRSMWQLYKPDEAIQPLDYYIIVIARIVSNAFTIYDDYLNDVGIGLYQVSSYFNHSCDPNAIQTFDDNSVEMSIKALRDIQEGEEIFISYIDLFYPTYWRKKELYKTYNFFCNCSRCLSPDNNDHYKCNKKNCYGICSFIGNDCHNKDVYSSWLSGYNNNNNNCNSSSHTMNMPIPSNPLLFHVKDINKILNSDNEEDINILLNTLTEDFSLICISCNSNQFTIDKNYPKYLIKLLQYSYNDTLFNSKNQYQSSEKSINEIIALSKKILPNNNYWFIHMYNSINKILENDISMINSSKITNKLFPIYINNHENYLNSLKGSRNIDNVNFRLTLDYIYFITFIVSNIDKLKESMEFSQLKKLLERVINSMIPYLIISVSVLYSNNHIFFYNINHLKSYIEEILINRH